MSSIFPNSRFGEAIKGLVDLNWMAPVAGDLIKIKKSD
jgi:hypothetical protein